MNYNNSHFKKLLKLDINVIIKEIINAVHFLSPIKNEYFRRNVKYSIKDYIIGIIDVVKNCTSWNSYSGLMNGNTLRIKFNEWVNLGIFEHVYKNTLKKYLKNTKKTEELKYQLIDSTFIEDINGSKYATYSGIYKRRKGEASKGIKITNITTKRGIPISININKAHQYDSPLLPDALNNRIINCKTKKYSKHNRYKQYLIGDPGYDSINNLKKIINEGYTPIIKQNIRNTKNENLIRVMNNKHKKFYKNRMKI